MSDTNNESKGFKVVDRRRFESDGDTKPEETPRTEPAPEQRQESSSAAEQPSGEHEKLPPMDFQSLIVSLATQALVLLGEIPDPTNRQLSLNLDAARQTIDLIALLQEKTKGNLTPEEDHLIEDALANLQLVFVRKVKEQRSAKKN